MKILNKSIFLSLITLLFLAGGTSFAASYCSDRLVDTDSGEQCDDGNFENYDGCSSYCQIEDLEPPTVASVSIADGSTNIPSTTRQVVVTFSEPINPETFNKFTFYIEHRAQLLNFDAVLNSANTVATITINQDLAGNARYAIHVNGIKDAYYSQMTEEFISVFDTGNYIDTTAPTVLLTPPPGKYSVTQALALDPYIDAYTGSEEYIDTTADVYYSIDGSMPSTSGNKFVDPIWISANTTLRYLAIDEAGNSTGVKSVNYTFDCDDLPYIKERDPYPSCKITKCIYGYLLKNNTCAVDLGGVLGDDIEANAMTAPYFPSDSPMTISTKPAIRLTPEHNGTFHRSVVFKDPTGKSTLIFDKGTKVYNKSGGLFDGLIIPPVTLYSKDYPINFGYTYKSIVHFESYDKKDLTFTPDYHLTVPYTDVYNFGEPVYVFSYDPATDQYSPYPSSKFNVDLNNNEVTITSDKTDIFFIAQKGESYNRSEFMDMENHWAKNYAEALYRRDIVKGRSKGIFAPNEPLTRAEFTKIVLKTIDAEVEHPDDVEYSLFRDVPLYAWYVAYVNKSKTLGLVNGYPDGSFRPDRPINRAEAIKMLLAAFEIDVSDYGVSSSKSRVYRDLLDNQWYFPYVHFAIQHDMLDGKINDNNTGFFPDWYGPDVGITRGEMAKLAIKVLEHVESQ